MNKTYNAVYYNSSGRFYNATIFLSSITLSVRYTDENNEVKDVYWLAENIISLKEEALASVLQYKNNVGQTERLVIRDPELLSAIKKHFGHHRFVGGLKHHVLGNTRNKIILFFSILLTLFLAGYFLFVPWLGERIARNISNEWEINMGEQLYQSMIGQYKVDSLKTKHINEFYKELHYKIKYPIHVTVVESKEMNAFAIPGGHIVVYRPILDKMRKPEELAALLSHEASHIELRHSLRNIFRSVARKMFLMMLIGNESGIAGYLVDNADNLKGLEYSRSLETEADNHGMGLMHSSNIDVIGMLGLMELLQEETRVKEPPAFLNTHPIFIDRIKNIKSLSSKKTTIPEEHRLLESIFKKLQQPKLEDSW
jgi:Zn-dependent protease with chaperone function